VALRIVGLLNGWRRGWILLTIDVVLVLSYSVHCSAYGNDFNQAGQI
jgi:hypothetical protein